MTAAHITQPDDGAERLGHHAAGAADESAADAGRQAREHDDAERLSVRARSSASMSSNARGLQAEHARHPLHHGHALQIMAQTQRAAAGLQSRRHRRRIHSARCATPVHVSAIIAAGGRGERLGAGQPKQLLLLGGLPILQRSVDALLSHARVHDLVVALPPELAAAPPAYLLHREKPVVVVAGGARRQDSVANAFARVPAHADVVVIHDAARPLVSADLIDRTIAAAAAGGAARGRRAARPTP